MKSTDPKLQQYIEVQFDGDNTLYLRYCDLTFAPNWNMIGVMWYEMDHGSWKHYFMYPQELETKYQLCLKQLSATEST